MLVTCHIPDVIVLLITDRLLAMAVALRMGTEQRGGKELGMY